jgi:phenylacetate-coenzyme A ligase PaaK-like adenylate-forming protein
VVISNLVNRGTMFFNYRLGDIAALSDEACSCGRTGRMLVGLEGRVEDMLFRPDGSFLHPRAVWAALAEAEGLLRYQFIQHDAERFELKLVTTTPQAYRSAVDLAVPQLQKMLGAVVIEAGRHEELPPDQAGKFRTVVSRYRPEEFS